MPEDHATALGVLTKRRETLLRNIEMQRSYTERVRADLETVLAEIAEMERAALELDFTINRLRHSGALPVYWEASSEATAWQVKCLNDAPG